MTKEELTICKMYLEDLDRTHDCNEYKLLMGLLEQQPSDDCVSRKDVLEMFGYETAIYELPPVTPTRKVGKWRRKLIDSGYNSVWLCSECKEMIHLEFHDFKFCPYCGANMRGSKNE